VLRLERPLSAAERIAVVSRRPSQSVTGDDQADLEGVKRQMKPKCQPSAEPNGVTSR
jgi:hypothetical protein